MQEDRWILAMERARAIIASFETVEASSDPVFTAFAELDALPEEVVREALASWAGPLPDPARLDDATRRAHGMPPRPLELCTLRVSRDADILDLGPVAEEQLRLAGKSWDGMDLAAEDRLDGEVDGALAGPVERRVLGDRTSRVESPLFDALLFAGDAGIVFTAGTTQVVAMIAYGKIESRDRRVRVALEAALTSEASVTRREGAPARESSASGTTREIAGPRPAAPRVVVPARPTAPSRESNVLGQVATREDVTKVTEKKAATAKKTAAKKTAAKKTAAKKTKPAKKGSAKKTAAKSARTASKGSAKKASASRQVTPKKVSSKKVSSTKVSSTKVSSRKAAASKGASSRKVATPAVKKGSSSRSKTAAGKRARRSR